MMVNMVATLSSLLPRRDNWTLLHESILRDNIDEAEILLQHGINKSSIHLVSPLDLALKQGDGEKVILLAISRIRSYTTLLNHPWNLPVERVLSYRPSRMLIIYG
jgi:hypothetical protein